MTRNDLPDLLYQLIKELGGKADMMTIFKKFWSEYETELRNSGDIFYTWNYDIRWAATKLRHQKRMRPAIKQENTLGITSHKGIWEIISD